MPSCSAPHREVLMMPTTKSLQYSSGQPISGVTIAALGADDAVLVVAATLYLVQLSGTVAAVVQQWTLDEAPRAVAVSPSREYILAVDTRHVRVWKRGDARPSLELEASADARMGASFGRSNGVDVLVHEPEPAQLELRELPPGTVAFSGRTETFRIESAVAVFGGTHVALTGYFRGEGKDSLAVVPLTELAQPAEILFRRFREKRPIADYAYRLAVGPCGNDALVIFRDPEDDEVPDEDDNNEVDTTAKADVRGLRGFYVRAADGSLRTKLDWDGGMKSHARLAATRSWIAAERDAQIALLPVTDAPWPAPVAARWLAESPDGSRVLVETEDGALAVLSLPE
jgi:hypothetical protein